ncbi:hypothetical protein ACU8L5_25540 (plasmid) [Rhizobium leguminosarum]
MRFTDNQGPLRVKVITGTRVILMVWDIDKSAQEDVKGFAIKRSQRGEPTPAEWLTGIKYFEGTVDNPKSRDQPFRTFLWSDYEAHPAVLPRGC